MKCRAAQTILPWLSCVVLLSCGTTDLGQGPEFLWWTDNESGDLSGWTADKAGSTWVADGASLMPVNSPARSGRFSIRSTVAPTSSASSGSPSSALLSRSGILPIEAFYSAWFYVPEAVASTEYWLFFKFRSRSNANVASTAVELWDLDFMSDGAAGMTVRLYHHDSGDVPALASWKVPLGRWFQAEAFLRAANDQTGRLTVWLDGARVFDITNEATVPSSFVEWGVGAATEIISPSSATLYLDDAAITTKRLGPDFPVFWGGQ